MDNFFPEVSALGLLSVTRAGSLSAGSGLRRPGGRDLTPWLPFPHPGWAKLSGSLLKSTPRFSRQSRMSKLGQVLFCPALPFAPGGSEGALPLAWLAGPPGVPAPGRPAELRAPLPGCGKPRKMSSGDVPLSKKVLVWYFLCKTCRLPVRGANPSRRDGLMK